MSVRVSGYPFVGLILEKLGVLDSGNSEFIRKAHSLGIKYADAAKRIPLRDDSVEVIYSCHMLEHLDRDEAHSFLKEAYRVLMPHGIMRLVLPDLGKMTDEYRAQDNADLFLESIHLTEKRPKALLSKLTHLFSGSLSHQWMYDGKSICSLLKSHHFCDPVILAPGETGIPEPDQLNLREREEEKSMYVETRKPGKI